MAIYKRGKNWYIDFSFHGQRIREMIGPSREGAQKVIDKRKGEIAENKFLDVRKEPEPIKFYDFAKEYLQWSKANKKPSSFGRDLTSMRQLTDPGGRPGGCANRPRLLAGGQGFEPIYLLNYFIKLWSKKYNYGLSMVRPPGERNYFLRLFPSCFFPGLRLAKYFS
jgi:hypothetical protein